MSQNLDARAALRPSIFRYHDYRDFIRDWLAFRRTKAGGGFSLNRFAREVDLSPPYLSRVLAYQRKLSTETASKVVKGLALTKHERAYFEHIRILSDSETVGERVEALKRLQRSRYYQKENSKELEVYRYFSHWYVVAIREMVPMEGFCEDPAWIQARLHYKVKTSEIKEALHFLLKHRFIQKDEQGRYFLPEGAPLDCVAGIYRLSLGEFHRQMLGMACEAIEKFPKNERKINALTLSMSRKSREKAFDIIEEALQKLAKLASDGPKEVLFQFNLAAFPLGDQKGVAAQVSNSEDEA